MDAKAIKELARQFLGGNGELIGVIVGEGLCIIAVPPEWKGSEAALVQHLYTQYRQLRTTFPVIRVI